jgi:alkanesulfonate monooxygenase SsuD/methylene tetrahydromethanopterin reductase-like flavin-dependent oxidoreductase (luciferase family)
VTLAFGIFGRSGLGPGAVAGVAARAERLGYGAAVVTETYSDVFPYAVACAHATRTMLISTAIANMGFRHPALMAYSAAETDALAEGRFSVGIGIGTQWFTRTSATAQRRRPLRAVREYVEIMRAVWCGERSYAGEIFELHDVGSDFRPPRPVPVFLAALNPGMCRLAGTIADGVYLGALIPLDRLPEAIRAVADGAHAAGRDPAAVTIASMVRVCVDDDEARALEGARASIPLYLTFDGYARYVTTLGYGSVVAAVREALARGDEAGAARQVPDELVERTHVFGRAERCRARVQAYVRAGVERPVILARPSPGAGWDETFRRTMDALAPASEAASR